MKRLIYQYFSLFRKELTYPIPITLATIFIFIEIFLLRLQLFLGSDFPLNDGGLFYNMTLDLERNSFFIPKFTTYNYASIPFAYPPFGLYVAGFLNVLFHIPITEIFRVLPLVNTTLGGIIVYLLAKEFFHSRRMALFSMMCMSLIPFSFHSFIMGGGITRSFGFLFSILALFVYLKFQTKPGAKLIFFFLAWLTLSILSHPEWGIFTMYSASIISIFFANSIKSLLVTIFYCFLAVTFSGVWWIQVIAYHGISPFLAALATGGSFVFSFTEILLLNFTDEFQFTFVAVLGCIGILQSLFSKKYFLPVWLLATYFLTPRSTPYFIPMGLLAAMGIENLRVSFLRGKKNIKKPPETISLLFLLLCGYLILVTYGNIFDLIQPNFTPIPSIDRQAMDWVSKHTPRQTFLVIIPDTFLPWYQYKINEWFPALTNSSNPTSIFGYEWKAHDAIFYGIDRIASFQKCIGLDISCFETWAQKNHIVFTYIYTYLGNQYTCCRIPTASLMNSKRYTVVYRNHYVAIFKRKFDN